MCLYFCEQCEAILYINMVSALFDTMQRFLDIESRIFRDYCIFKVDLEKTFFLDFTEKFQLLIRKILFRPLIIRTFQDPRAVLDCKTKYRSL